MENKMQQYLALKGLWELLHSFRIAKMSSIVTLTLNPISLTSFPFHTCSKKKKKKKKKLTKEL